MKIASGAALGMRAGASRDVMEVHRMLAHPSEDITRKTTEMMGIETTAQWGGCKTCFQAKAKRHAVPKKTDERSNVRTRKIVERQAVQWVDGPKKAGGDDTGSDDRGMKSAGDGTIVERGTPQLNVQELGQEQQQLTLHEHETQEAFGTGSDDRGMKSAGDGTIIERGTPQLNIQELGQEQQLTLHEHKTQEAFGTGSDDRGMKSAGDGTIVERGALQLEVQELELEQQPASSLELRKEVQEAPPDPEQGTREAPPDLAEDTQEAPPNPEKETREVPLDPEEKTWEVPWDPEKETREVPLDLKEGTQEASPYPEEETREAPSIREDEAQGTPSYPEEETREAPSDPEEEILEAPSDSVETKYAAELAEGPTDLEGPVVPVSRKRTIGGNLPPNNLKAHV